MSNMEAKAQTYTEEDIFYQLKEILLEVAPYKIVGEVTPEKSLVKDFSFDSIDTMGMLLKVQERLLKNRSIIDVDQFINRAFKANDSKTATVSHICTLINEIINSCDGDNNGKEN